MRRRLLAGALAAGITVTTMAIGTGTAAADYTSHPSCVLLHFTLNRTTEPDIVHFCV